MEDAVVDFEVLDAAAEGAFETEDDEESVGPPCCVVTVSSSSPS